MFFAHQNNREVSEWLKELAWKASIWVTVSRVRIPSSLPAEKQMNTKPTKFNDLVGFFRLWQFKLFIK